MTAASGRNGSDWWEADFLLPDGGAALTSVVPLRLGSSLERNKLMVGPVGVPQIDDDFLLRLERKAARIYVWIEENGAADLAKSERYRVEADL